MYLIFCTVFLQNRYKVDDNWQGKCYKIANKAWKEYKTSRLAKNYVFPYLETLDENVIYKIPEGHPWITPQVWKDFVDYRRSEEFQIIREGHQNVQMHNILPNRTGRSSNPEVRFRMVLLICLNFINIFILIFLNLISCHC